MKNKPSKAAIKPTVSKKRQSAQASEKNQSGMTACPEAKPFVTIKKEHVLKNGPALSKIPIHLVANLAGSLSWIDQQASIEDRVRIAYHLLDATASANSSISSNGCMQAGLKQHTLFHILQHIGEASVSDAENDPLLRTNESGTAYEPVKFDAALDSIFGRETRKKDREDRLTLFFQKRPGDSPISRKTAKEIIKKWKAKGIPPEEYTLAKTLYHPWYSDYKVWLRSQAGKSPKKNAKKPSAGR